VLRSFFGALTGFQNSPFVRSTLFFLQNIKQGDDKMKVEITKPVRIREGGKKIRLDPGQQYDGELAQDLTKVVEAKETKKPAKKTAAKKTTAKKTAKKSTAKKK
jgi:topoisomerase IA-like protein